MWIRLRTCFNDANHERGQSVNDPLVRARDKRKTGEGAMKGWTTRRAREERRQCESDQMEEALLAWVQMQSSENAHRLYNAAIAYFGIKPAIPD